MGKIFSCQSFALVEAGLAQSVERLTAEREVAGSIPVAEPILRVLIKITEKWRYYLCTAISARPCKMAVPSPVGEVKILSPVSTFVLNTLTLKSSVVIFFFEFQDMWSSTIETRRKWAKHARVGMVWSIQYTRVFWSAEITSNWSLQYTELFRFGVYWEKLRVFWLSIHHSPYPYPPGEVLNFPWYFLLTLPTAAWLVQLASREI